MVVGGGWWVAVRGGGWWVECDGSEEGIGRMIREEAFPGVWSRVRGWAFRELRYPKECLQ